MMVEEITAVEYQRETSYERTTLGGGALDWLNQPTVYKRYSGGASIPLVVPDAWPQQSLSDVSRLRPDPSARRVSVAALSLALALAYAITARTSHAGQDFHYRSVPSAGALYPCELYVAAQAVDGLEAGLYHYEVGRHVLTRVRPRETVGLVRGLLMDPTERNPSVCFFITTIFFRSAWKYRKRCYRYLLLDSGHLLENLMVSLRLMQMVPQVTWDFHDAETNRFLGLDPQREGCLALAWIPGPPAEAGPERAQDRLHPVEPEACRVSAREVTYPVVQWIHRACSRVVRLGEPKKDLGSHLGAPVSVWLPLEPDSAEFPAMALADAIRNRRSRRNFVRQVVDQTVWKRLLLDLCRTGPDPGGTGDWPMGQDQTVCVGLLCRGLAGLADGFYRLDRKRMRLGLVRSGDFPGPMAHACLEQAWLANAACHFLFLTRLDLLESVWGPRGYRYALLEAGRLAQRLYLNAEGHGLGACGIGAFFDREARELLDLHDASAMTYLLALGPVKKSPKKRIQ